MGKINVNYVRTALPVVDADITTDVGTINFVGPDKLSVMLDASVGVGSVDTDLPVTLIGKISKKRLKGTIGKGEGNLRLKTDVGSIKIK